MAESFDTREPVATLKDDGAKFSIDDLPKELLVSIFVAVGDLHEVRLINGLYMKDWTPESLAHLEAFQAKLLVENPSANVFHEPYV